MTDEPAGASPLPGVGIGGFARQLSEGLAAMPSGSAAPAAAPAPLHPSGTARPRRLPSESALAVADRLLAAAGAPAAHTSGVPAPDPPAAAPSSDSIATSAVPIVGTPKAPTSWAPPVAPTSPASRRDAGPSTDDWTIPRAKTAVFRGPDGVEHRVSAGESLTIGRAPGDGGVTVDRPEVSRRHARIDFADGLLTVVDLGSTNGTNVVSKGALRAVEARVAVRLGIGDRLVVLDDIWIGDVLEDGSPSRTAR